MRKSRSAHRAARMGFTAPAASIDMYDDGCDQSGKSGFYRNKPAVRAGIVTKVPSAPPSWERKKTSRAWVMRLW